MSTPRPGQPPRHRGEPVSAAVEVAAPADDVWALLTDLDGLAALAEETESMAWRRGHRAEPGAVFTGANRNGAKAWSTTCTVVAAEAGRSFAFDVAAGPLPIARWRYDVEPLPSSADGAARCRVTETTWDRRPGWFVRPGGWLTGVPDRASASRVHIEATLERLRAHFA